MKMKGIKQEIERLDNITPHTKEYAFKMLKVFKNFGRFKLKEKECQKCHKKWLCIYNSKLCINCQPLCFSCKVKDVLDFNKILLFKSFCFILVPDKEKIITIL